MPNTISIANEYLLSLRFNGEDFDFDKAQFSGMEIYEAANSGLPIMEIRLTDFDQLMKENPIRDGSLVEVILTKKRRITEDDSMNFRVIKPEIFRIQEAFVLTLKCFLDYPNWLFKSFIETFKGTASQVVEQIAGINNLNFDIDPTADSQTWINPGYTHSRFMYHIARHAYLDNLSAYSFGIDRKNTLKFYNLNLRRDQNVDYTFKILGSVEETPDDPETEVFIEDYEVFNSAGIYNKFFGYGRNTTRHNLLSSSVNPEKVEIIQAPKSTDFFNVNVNHTGTMRFETTPFDIGNVHDNYHRAFKQNQKILSLHSTGVECLASVPLDVTILNRVNLKLSSPGSNEINELYSGNYFVEKMSTIIEPEAFYAKYRLRREGINTNQEIEDLL